jgi:A/G-specific adenine glycosylase
VQQDCAASARGLVESLPIKAQKLARPSRYGAAFLVQREDGAVLLRQRPEAGLLGGMLEVPSTHWGDALPSKKEALRSAPVTTSWIPVPGAVVHIFTHFRLELVVYRALVPVDASFTLWAEQDRCRWVHRRDLHAQALPSVMKKVIAHGMNAE